VALPCRPAVVGALPRSLYLETTNRCDSKCQTCIRTFQTLEPPADLTLERVRAIVEQCPVLDRVVLHGIGEPLLNREIFDIVAYLKTRVASVLFNSDAILLTPPRARRLVESGLDEFRVSIDAATAETYRRLRGVDRFERVTANVERLVALERDMGVTRPQISLWFTASQANIEELPAFVELAARLDVGEVYVQRLVFNGLGLATEANALHGKLRERERVRLGEAEALAARHGIAMRASGRASVVRVPAPVDAGLRHGQRQRPSVLHLPLGGARLRPTDPRQCVQRTPRVDLGRSALSALPPRLREPHAA
jgi:MoaA/NifB/PqqE/SkfB family radical SAM enzyme